VPLFDVELGQRTGVCRKDCIRGAKVSPFLKTGSFSELNKTLSVLSSCRLSGYNTIGEAKALALERAGLDVYRVRFCEICRSLTPCGPCKLLSPAHLAVYTRRHKTCYQTPDTFSSKPLNLKKIFLTVWSHFCPGTGPLSDLFSGGHPGHA
jgi:hypothetical protein